MKNFAENHAENVLARGKHGLSFFFGLNDQRSPALDDRTGSKFLVKIGLSDQNYAKEKSQSSVAAETPCVPA